MKQTITIPILASLVIAAITFQAQAFTNIRQDNDQPLTQSECSKLPDYLIQLQKQAQTQKLNQKLAGDLYTVGQSLEECKHFDDAIAAYRLSGTVNQTPSKEETIDWYIATVLIKQQKLDEAQTLLRGIFTNSPSAKELTENKIESRIQNRIGSVLLKDRRLDLAQPYFEAAIRLDPNSSSATQNLVSLYIQQKKFDSAVSIIETNEEIFGTDNLKTPRRQKARAYSSVGLLSQNHGDLPTAKQWFQKAVSVDPGFDAPYLWLSQIYEKEKNYDAAISTLERLLTISSSLPRVHYTIGNYYLRKNEIDNALSHYKQTIAPNSDQIKDPDAYAHRLVGDALNAQKRYAEAAEMYQKASLQDSVDIQLLKNWGTVLWEIQEWEKAIAVFEQAQVMLTEQNQVLSSIPMLIQLAEAYANLNRVDDALAVLKPLVETDFFDPRLDLAYGKLLIQVDKMTEATEYFKTARGGTSQVYWGYFSPEEAMVLMTQGKALSDLDRHPEAIKLFEQAIVIDPEFAYAHSALGNSLRHQGRYDEAVAAYQKALQIRPWEWEMRNHFLSGLGLTFLAQNQLDQAKGTFQQAIHYQSQNVDAQYGLGLTLQKQGKREEAIAIFKKVLELEPHHELAQQALNTAQ